MRSSILLPPRHNRKLKGLAQMAATENSVQRLTFYEDLYLKPHKKSASMPSRRTAATSTEVRRSNRRQSSISESERKSWSQSPSPVNNPLLDSPPSSRPLTLATNGRKATDNQTPVIRDTNNNNDYLRLSETAVIAGPKVAAPTKPPENIYENHRFIRQARAHKSPSLPLADHVYEVIPAQLPGFYYKTHYLTDESNYLVPAVAAQENGVKMRRCNQGKCANTNLRSMRRMGRSVDSIRTAQDSRLRSQSTILAPQLWMKTSNTSRLANSTSCDNLLTNHGDGLSRLSSLTSPDKENSSPYTCTSKHPTILRNKETSRRKNTPSVTSPQLQRSPEGQSKKTTSKSLTDQQPKHIHRHSSSYAGSSSAYENMSQIHKVLQNSRSEYVNIEDYKSQAPDLNYADLDLTLQKPSQKPASNRTSRTSTSSPTKGSLSASESNDDTVEYTLINIAATEAARLACAEHQQDRQRRSHFTSSAKALS